MKVSGKSASAHMKTAEELLEILDNVVVEENYWPEKIFLLVEASLVPEINAWKN